MKKESNRFSSLGVILLAMIGSLAIASCGRQAPLTSSHAGIEIVGNQRFVGQVRQALVLLEREAPEEFGTVQQYVKRIKQGPRSGMWADQDPPTFEMGDRTTFHSVTWCAGAIAHDSYHSRLYHEYREAHGESVPYEAWGDAREPECIAFQLTAMEKIGTPNHELQYVRSLDGSHPDLNKDGKYDWDDYQQVDW